jgi:chemotaxis protein MotB
MTMHTATRLGTVLVAIVGSIGLGGCSDELKQENADLRAENVELRDALDAERRRADSSDTNRDQLLARIGELEGELAGRGGAANTGGNGKTGFDGIGGVEVEQGTRGEITVRVPGDVLFASGKVDLKSSAKTTLAQVARVLKSDYAGKNVRVEGHSDSDPIKKSKWKDNLELSSQRAMAVARYLSSQGVGAKRVSAVGRGEHHPRASNSTRAGKAQNRRVEIVVVMN